MAIKINIKPLSVNDAWQGKRFKTKLYKRYERDLLLTLPRLTLPEKPYYIFFEFGINTLADWDNPVKPLQDILQKKYGFDDRYVEEGNVKKTIVKKGQEFLKFEILNEKDVKDVIYFN